MSLEIGTRLFSSPLFMVDKVAFFFFSSVGSFGKGLMCGLSVAG